MGRMPPNHSAAIVRTILGEPCACRQPTELCADRVVMRKFVMLTTDPKAVATLRELGLGLGPMK